jgi:F-type H+-transporting ATPase subunit delta
MIRRFARPYAKAVLELTGSPEAARDVATDLARFDDARRSSADLQAVLANPGVGADVKERILDALSARLDLAPLSRRVLTVVVVNHRINQLTALVETLREMVNEALGIAVAEVTTAHELSSEERSRLQSALESRFGRRVEMDVRRDEALLGGFVARVGSEVWDASVDGHIEKFRKSLT